MTHSQNLRTAEKRPKYYLSWNLEQWRIEKPSLCLVSLLLFSVMAFVSCSGNTNQNLVLKRCGSQEFPEPLVLQTVPDHHPPSCVLLIAFTLWTPWPRSPHCSHELINASVCKWAQLPNCCTWFFFFRVICQRCNEAPSWMMKQTEASLFSLRNLKASIAETLRLSGLWIGDCSCVVA